jgi:hypothetical protein
MKLHSLKPEIDELEKMTTLQQEMYQQFDDMITQAEEEGKKQFRKILIYTVIASIAIFLLGFLCGALVYYKK